jgi:hypothetical protein
METIPTNQGQSTAQLGVVLMAFGKPQYYWAAYNLAYSIKRFNKSIQIALISEPSEKGSLYYCPELADVIDLNIDLPNANYNTNKKLDPAKAKLLIYDLLPFDSNLILDVDGVCLKDLNPLLQDLSNSKKDYQAIKVGSHTIDKGRDFKEMIWAYADNVFEHFELPKDAELIAINSSAQFVRKSETAKELFQIASDLLINTPLPTSKLRSKWGGGQPDELYLNVAITKLKLDVELENDIVYLTNKRELEFAEIQQKYFIMGYFGGQGYTSRYYIDWLDRLLKSWFKKDNGNHK